MSALVGGGEVHDAIIGIIEREIGASLDGDVRNKLLQSDLGLDSLSMIDLAVAAEEAFGIRIPDDDLERFVTVGDVTDYVERTSSQSSSPSS